MQLLSQCGSTCNCLNKSVPEIHSHVAGTLSNQPTNKQTSEEPQGFVTNQHNAALSADVSVSHGQNYRTGPGLCSACPHSHKKERDLSCMAVGRWRWSPHVKPNEVSIAQLLKTEPKRSEYHLCHCGLHQRLFVGWLLA